MGEVIYLDNMAFVMNKVRKSIEFMSSINAEGRYDEALKKDRNLLRSFMDGVIQRPQAA